MRQAFRWLAQAANPAKAHILQQSSIAALSQANAASQAVLRLLQESSTICDH
jgi:flagellin-like hook-associated protein FlgL